MAFITSFLSSPLTPTLVTPLSWHFGNGDSIAVAGELSIKTYKDKAGETKIGLDLTAHAVISQYDVQRKRRAVAEGTTP